MFENMTPRERILALTVGSLLPIGVLFLAFLWFMETYESNALEILSLKEQVKQQEDKKELGMLASQRQGYYRKVSLPATERRTKSVYKTWLNDLVVKESGMTYDGVKLKDGNSIMYDRKPIGRRIPFTVRPRGTLSQLITFLHGFYSADHLHRINKLSIKPIAKTKRGKVEVLTGELQMEIDIETLSLKKGPNSIEDFPTWRKELSDVNDYTKRILARNIFGPKNNTPSLNKPKKLKFMIAKSEEAAKGKYETIQISATDGDADDILAFELIEKSGQDKNYGLVLSDQPRSSSVRKISLRVPKQSKPGRIPVSLQVTDNGLPSKSDQIDFTLVFEAPKKKVKDPDPVMVAEASVTRVIGLMKNRQGHWVARVQFADEIKSQELGQGDSIKLDDVDWKVVDVGRKSVTFEAEGKQMSFEVSKLLDQPMVMP